MFLPVLVYDENPPLYILIDSLFYFLLEVCEKNGSISKETLVSFGSFLFVLYKINTGLMQG
jgi:hypothetical protein